MKLGLLLSLTLAASSCGSTSAPPCSEVTAASEVNEEWSIFLQRVGDTYVPATIERHFCEPDTDAYDNCPQVTEEYWVDFVRSDISTNILLSETGCN